MGPLDDTARFHPDDDAELVALSFACPVCLCIDSEVAVDPGRDDACAACSCRRCGIEWTVGLDPWQVVRLSLAPPRRSGDRWNLRLRFREVVR